MGKNKINSHPLSAQIIEHIRALKLEGIGIRQIASSLLDLFELKISYTGLNSWIKKQPPQLWELSTSEKKDSERFCEVTYRSLLPQNPSFTDELKAKLYTLTKCNLDNHIAHNKRLNLDYLKHLKAIEEVESLCVRNDRESRRKVSFINQRNEDVNFYIQVFGNDEPITDEPKSIDF